MHRCLSVLLLVWATATMAGDVYFRSDGGVAKDAGHLPEKFDKPLWKVELASGHSTPVVANGKIFLTCYEANELATVALEEKTGRRLWKRAAPASRIESVHRVGSPAAATPACDGRNLYVFFGSYGLICYDLNGDKVWERPLGPFQDEFGAASSPVLVDGKVILAQDHDINSFVMALDAATGKTLWKTDRPDAVRSYSTPAVWQRNGRQEVLVAGALQLISYDPDTGKKLWWKDGLARIVIPIPVPAGEMVYMASWAPGADSGQRLTLDPWKNAVEKWDANRDGRLAKAEVNDAQVLDRFFRMDLDQSQALDQKEWERHAEVFQRAQNAIL